MVRNVEEKRLKQEIFGSNLYAQEQVKLQMKINLSLPPKP